MRYLIWDVDGTLAYRDGMWSGTLLEVLDRHRPEHRFTIDQIRPYLQSGFPWHTPERTHCHITTADAWWAGLEPLFADAYRGLGLEPPEAARLVRHVRRQYCDPSRWRLFDDVLPALAALTAQGWSHLVLSNHVPELSDLLRGLGLLPYVRAVYNSAVTGVEKPHPRAFQQVLDDIGPYERLWMIGDSWAADIEGAARAGIAGILVRAQHPAAKHACERLTEVVALVSEP